MTDLNITRPLAPLTLNILAVYRISMASRYLQTVQRVLQRAAEEGGLHAMTALQQG